MHREKLTFTFAENAVECFAVRIGKNKRQEGRHFTTWIYIALALGSRQYTSTGVVFDKSAKVGPVKFTASNWAIPLPQ